MTTDPRNPQTSDGYPIVCSPDILDRFYIAEVNDSPIVVAPGSTITFVFGWSRRKKLCIPVAWSCSFHSDGRLVAFTLEEISIRGERLLDIPIPYHPDGPRALDNPQACRFRSYNQEETLQFVVRNDEASCPMMGSITVWRKP